MCLVSIAWQQHPDLALLIAANRDERFDRPSDPLGWWHADPDILGGRDREAGGAWLALHRCGRFGVVTNFREMPGKGDKPRSRGDLVTDWLTGDMSTDDYAEAVLTRGADYAGFNLLYGDPTTLAYVSNRTDQHGPLAPGTYALSNGLLDSAWPKVDAARRAMAQAAAAGRRDPYAFMPFLTDTTQAPDNQLPVEDIDIERRRALSAPFILDHRYGTRCSTVVSMSTEGDVQMFEQRFEARGTPVGHDSASFRIRPID
ncbi:MAG: NRDE family protein [Pseudomonadota bacterium]